jgi:hypothetical protein
MSLSMGTTCMATSARDVRVNVVKSAHMQDWDPTKLAFWLLCVCVCLCVYLNYEVFLSDLSNPLAGNSRGMSADHILSWRSSESRIVGIMVCGSCLGSSCYFTYQAKINLIFWPCRDRALYTAICMYTYRSLRAELLVEYNRQLRSVWSI